MVPAETKTNPNKKSWISIKHVAKVNAFHFYNFLQTSINKPNPIGNKTEIQSSGLKTQPHLLKFINHTFHLDFRISNKIFLSLEEKFKRPVHYNRWKTNLCSWTKVFQQLRRE